MRTMMLLPVIAIAMFSSVNAYAQDEVAGEAIYQSVCKNCHGPTAKGMASFPKLAGSTAEYLSMRLEQYRAGEKVSHNSPLMWPLAAELTDEDIANVSAYISNSFEK